MRVAVRQNNRRVNRLRSVVERVIAPVLTGRVLHTGLGGRRVLLWRVFSSAAGGLVFFAAWNPL